MPTFLNIDLDRKLNLDFAIKHLFFSLFWLVGLFCFIFRIDLILFHHSRFDYIIPYIPFGFIVIVLAYLLCNPWYYILAFLVYPMLLIFWFIPKSIMTVGKIYMFGNYVNSIASWFYNFKTSILNLILLTSTLAFIFTSNKFAMVFVMCSITYFYLQYLFRLLQKAFSPPSMFGSSLQQTISSVIQRPDKSDFLLKSFIAQKDDEKLEIEVRREKQVRRVMMFNYCAELLKQRIVGHSGRQAYMISWLFGSFMFLVYSIMFFSFLNLHLFKVSPDSFAYGGSYESFDFFYYTLKTITFGDIEIVRPISILARIFEISSFFVIGIFILVVFLSIILSMKQDRLNENLRLTTELIDSETAMIKSYIESEFGANLKSLAKEVKNLDDSLKNLRSFIERLF